MPPLNALSPLHFAMVAGLVLGIAACATQTADGPDEKEHDEQEKGGRPLDDPRIGEQVNRLCFAIAISGFNDWDGGDGVIVRKGVRDRYLVTLLPGCTPIRNAQRIGVTDRFGSGCLERGDRLFVSSDIFPSRRSSPFDSDFCRIKAIYEWKDAPEADTEADETDPDSETDE